MRCATIDLSKRSAISPPSPDRKKNGPMKTAAVSVTSPAAWASVIVGVNRIKKPSELLRKLSLKALKNWHQKRGAKRRVVMRLEDIAGPSGIDARRRGRRRESHVCPGQASSACGYGHHRPPRPR